MYYDSRYYDYNFGSATLNSYPGSASYYYWPRSQCVAYYGENDLAALTLADKMSLGIMVAGSVSAEYARKDGTSGATFQSVPRRDSTPLRDYILEPLRKIKEVTKAQLFMDPQERYIWFYYETDQTEQVLECWAEPNPKADDDGPATTTPTPWFKTPNGKRYLDEWRHGRLQAGTYVFSDAGGSVQCVDPTKPKPGDPIPGDVLFYVHTACAFVVHVSPGLLRAPCGIQDVVT